MDRDDREEYPIGEYDFTVIGETEHIAIELATDALHECVPMSRPEDFDIEVISVKPSPIVEPAFT